MIHIIWSIILYVYTPLQYNFIEQLGPILTIHFNSIFISWDQKWKWQNTSANEWTIAQVIQVKLNATEQHVQYYNVCLMCYIIWNYIEIIFKLKCVSSYMKRDLYKK